MAKTADNLDLLNRAGSTKFSDLIFETLSEKTPTEQESKLFELVLNLSIDHGPDTPSAQATITAANNGKDFGEAVGAGVSQINDVHGGAIEPLMRLIYQVKDGKPNSKTAPELVRQYIAEGKKFPGFGHRIYKDVDPRAQLIMTSLKDVYGDTPYSAIAEELHYELNHQTGKQLPFNIDGAIAAALCSFGWEPKLGKAVFIVARNPGLCAHYLNNHS